MLSFLVTAGAAPALASDGPATWSDIVAAQSMPLDDDGAAASSSSLLPHEGPSSQPEDEKHPVVAARPFGNLPLHFEPNLGQTHEDVAFTARASGYTFFLTPEEAVFVIPDLRSASSDDPAPLASPKREAQRDLETANRVVRMRFMDANPNPRFTSENTIPGVSNYFHGSDPTRWVTDVPHYERVVVHDLWQGIDAVFYDTNEKAVQYDFIVHPGADPATVRLVFEGARLDLEADGSLVLDTGVTSLRQPPPVTYQDVEQNRLKIESSYDLLDPDTGILGFHVQDFDGSRPLVIDPVVIAYSTYIGGSDSDLGRAIAVDADGSAYVTGSTRSLNYPVQNAYQPAKTTTSDTDWDAFVTKLTPAGDALSYSTYLGGIADDIGSGIAVDTDGYAYVTGRTASLNFPTANAYQASKASTGDGSDAFVTKLTPAGNALTYSTYLGGSSDDIPLGITADQTGTAYVTGYTDSADYPTQNAFRPSGAGREAFVTKITPAGDALHYSTYLGGSGLDIGTSIAVDADGSAYIVGGTRSTDFPTSNAYQTTRPGPLAAFVTKLTPAGNALTYSTYLGGGGDDVGEGIAVDTQGNAYVTGDTKSTNFPTHNPYQPNRLGSTSAFVTKLTPAGNTLAYSTYLGGSRIDFGVGIAVDAAGNAWVTGSTGSRDFPVTPDAYQPMKGGDDTPGFDDYDVFVAKFSPDDNALTYSTYLGGTGDDKSWGIAVDPDGNAYVTGQTWWDFPVTPNAYQTIATLDVNGFAAKLYSPPYAISPAMGARTIETRPPCADDIAPCPSTTLGFTDDLISPTPGTWTFDLQLGDLDAHADRLCALDDSCSHWLKLNLTVSGNAPTVDGHEVPIALLRWQAPNLTYQPARGHPILARVHHDNATQDTWLEIPPVHLPIAAFEDAHEQSGKIGRVIKIRMEAIGDQWNPQGAPWDVNVTEAQVQLVGRPVIFVQGWATEACLSEEEYYLPPEWRGPFIQDLRELATDPLGQDPWDWGGNSSVYTYEYHRKQSFRSSARELYDAVDAAKALLGYQGNITIIAHSMGGLVSRFLLEDRSFRDTLTAQAIDRLITVETPHLGSAWADARTTGLDFIGCPSDGHGPPYYVQKSGQPLAMLRGWAAWWDRSVDALRRWDQIPIVSDFELKAISGNPVLRELNAQPRADAEYVFIGARVSVPYLLGFRKVFEGDGVVSTQSATYGFAPDACKRILDVQRTSELSVHSTVFEENALHEILRNIIVGFGQDTCQDLTLSWYSPQRLLRKLPFVWSSTPSASMASDTVGVATASSAGWNLATQWNLTAVDNATLSLMAPAGMLSGRNMTLYAPDMKNASFGDEGEIGGLQWLLLQDGAIDHLYVLIEPVQSGTWTLVVHDLPSEDVPLFGGAEFFSPWLLKDVSDTEVRFGTTIKIAVSFRHDDDPVTGASVEARVFDNQLDQEVHILLVDDGQGPDAIAGDGVYTAEYFPLSAGNHHYAISAQFDNITREIERELAVMITGTEANRTCTELWIAKHLKLTNEPLDPEGELGHGSECVPADMEAAIQSLE